MSAVIAIVMLRVATRYIQPFIYQIWFHINLFGMRRGIKIYWLEFENVNCSANLAVIGLFNLRRIIMSEKLKLHLKPFELQALVLHEVGHVKLNHPEWRMLIESILLLVVACVSGLLFRSSFYWVGCIVVPLLVFVGFAVLNAFNRRFEYEADAYAVQQYGMHGEQAFVEALQKLSDLHVEAPSPTKQYGRWVAYIMQTHPTVEQRINTIKNR